MSRRALNFVVGLLILPAYSWMSAQCSSSAVGARILLVKINPVSARSHNMMLSALTGGLVSSGHNVTLVTDDVKGTNGFPDGTFNQALHFKGSYREEDISELFKVIQKGLMANGCITLMSGGMEALQLGFSNCLHFWGDQKLLQHLKNMDLDLVVVYGFSTTCEVLLARYLDVPFVIFLTSMRSPMFHEGFTGVPYPSSYVPYSVWSTYTDEMTFFQRLRNVFSPLVMYMSYLTQLSYRSIKKEHDIDPGKSFMELYATASLVLCHSSLASEFPRPYTPNVIPIGGLLARPAQPLPKDLEDFVQGSGDHGVIVFTLGSAVKGLETEATAETFARVFSRLPQRVLWRHSRELKPPASLGENTRLLDWLPQNDLLGHPKTRLLIYHGGSNGVHESIYHGVPMVIIPLFADQPAHGARVQKKGMGLMLDKGNITDESLMAVVTEVLNNPRYKERAMHFSKIHHDSPMTPLETAVYWIEHVIKFGGEHLRPRSADMGIIELYMIDVAAFLVLLLFIGLYVDYLIIKKCYSCCRERRRQGTKSKDD